MWTTLPFFSISQIESFLDIFRFGHEGSFLFLKSWKQSPKVIPGRIRTTFPPIGGIGRVFSQITAELRRKQDYFVLYLQWNLISVIRYIFIAAIHTWNTFWPRFNSIKSVVIIAFQANTCFVIIFFHFHSIFADISEALFWLENMSCLFRWTFQVHCITPVLSEYLLEICVYLPNCNWRNAIPSSYSKVRHWWWMRRISTMCPFYK